MHNMQALIDGWAIERQRIRAKKMMTLGKLIGRLKQMPQDRPIVFDFDLSMSPLSLMSYRGYYCDLSVDRSEPGSVVTVESFLEICKDAMGRVFTGYKGGEFLMGENTPIWISEYGLNETLGFESIDFDEDSYLVVIKTKEEEDE